MSLLRSIVFCTLLLSVSARLRQDDIPRFKCQCGETLDEWIGRFVRDPYSKAYALVCDKACVGGTLSAHALSTLQQKKELTSLTIVGTGGSGPILPELGLLSGLETLNISRNSFDGQVPLSLALLTSLKTVDMRGNPLLFVPDSQFDASQWPQLIEFYADESVEHGLCNLKAVRRNVDFGNRNGECYGVEQRRTLQGLSDDPVALATVLAVSVLATGFIGACLFAYCCGP